MTCRTGITCDHSETCLKTDCEGHPSHPFNKWGAGRPVTTDGGHSVNGSIAIQLHRQVMPPEPAKPASERANAIGWTVLVFAIASAAALIFLGVEPSLPFQPR